MGVKYNPFAGNLDIVDSPSGDFTDLDVSGDITLDDGGTYTTTVQVVTPTANRTISFPDATGTVALVAGSSGQVTYNNAGALAGFNGLTIDGSGNLSGGGVGTTSPAVAWDVVGQVRASTGILFGTDTAAANALDDYEEGTWTPTLNWTGVTYTVQSGYYTKIGNTVHVHATITWTANDVASATVISGLPFATSSVTDIGAVKINDVAVPATLSYNSLEAAFSSLYVRYINTSGVSINYPVAANDAGTINVNCVYKVA